METEVCWMCFGNGRIRIERSIYIPKKENALRAFFRSLRMACPMCDGKVCVGHPPTPVYVLKNEYQQKGSKDETD